MSRVAFTLNGAAVSIETDPARRLIDVLRLDLGLTGVKPGCDIGRCGSCMVLLDGVPANACMLLAVRLAGRNVVTVEGLGDCGEVASAMAEEGAIQCGYCTPGLLVALTWLLRQDPTPGREEAEAMLSGNICRCTGYAGTRRVLDRLLPGAPKSGASRQETAA